MPPPRPPLFFKFNAIDPAGKDVEKKREQFTEQNMKKLKNNEALVTSGGRTHRIN